MQRRSKRDPTVRLHMGQLRIASGNQIVQLLHDTTFTNVPVSAHGRACCQDSPPVKLPTQPARWQHVDCTDALAAPHCLACCPSIVVNRGIPLLSADLATPAPTPPLVPAKAAYPLAQIGPVVKFAHMGFGDMHRVDGTKPAVCCDGLVHHTLEDCPRQVRDGKP